MIKPLLLAAALVMPALGIAQSAPKYFGYFGADYPANPAVNEVSELPEFQDHINLYSIQYWNGDSTTVENKEASQRWILSQLALAKAAHVHAIVPGHPFVLRKERGNDCYSLDTDAERAWNEFTQKMLDGGYLVPGNPALSTVVAVYVADEPNAAQYCLADQNGAVNPTFQHAIFAIRNNPATAHLALAAILTPPVESFSHGAQLLDWVGYDHYGDKDSTWYDTMRKIKDMAPGKRYIIVPGATPCQGVGVENTDRYFETMQSDASVAWIAPFKWQTNTDGCPGIRDEPNLRPIYVNEGLKIKNQQCNASSSDRQFCGLVKGISPIIDTVLDD